MELLGHRGPADSMICRDEHACLGHARLSIIDLSGGRQPMTDDRGARRVVFNGEIYNYRELGRDLGEAQFRTDSDTEVLLHLAAGERAPADWVSRLDGMFAFAVVEGDVITPARDPLGTKPLYVGRHDGALVFGWEIKAMLVACDEVSEFPAGHVYTSETGLRPYFDLEPPAETVTEADRAERGVSARLAEAVRKRLLADVPVGVFLSGGLDSSLIAAFASRYKQPLDSFAVGTDDSEDLARSREVTDELFAGYEHLKAIARDSLQDELHQITLALHNTNLQRCDRMSMAHGLEVRLPFLDVDMVRYAFQIHRDLKSRGEARTEKWILRRVAEGMLPSDIVWRPKEKCAIGSGLGDRLARFAETQIADEEFAREREVGESVTLPSKEELCYYRIFRERYPAEKLVPLVGRSRSV